jgi:DNA-binding response OmpR family regulator
VLEPVLGAAGYRVTTALDGGSAIWNASAEQPDVILLDLGLPDSDRIETFRAARDKAPATRNARPASSA